MCKHWKKYTMACKSKSRMMIRSGIVWQNTDLPYQAKTEYESLDDL